MKTFYVGWMDAYRSGAVVRSMSRVWKRLAKPYPRPRLNKSKKNKEKA